MQWNVINIKLLSLRMYQKFVAENQPKPSRRCGQLQPKLRVLPFPKSDKSDPTPLLSSPSPFPPTSYRKEGRHHMAIVTPLTSFHSPHSSSSGPGRVAVTFKRPQNLPPVFSSYCSAQVCAGNIGNESNLFQVYIQK